MLVVPLQEVRRELDVLLEHLPGVEEVADERPLPLVVLLPHREPLPVRDVPALDHRRPPQTLDVARVREQRRLVDGHPQELPPLHPQRLAREVLRVVVARERVRRAGLVVVRH